jgi:hypothetical protein
VTQTANTDHLIPSYLHFEDDTTHPVKEIPLWSESYQTDVYDPQSRTGIHMHFGRAPFNVRLWHDIFAAYLPNDEFLVAKNFRFGDNPGHGPAGGGVVYECEEPFRQWTKRFSGAAMRVTGEQLRSGALVDGLHTGVEMEITCRAVTPAFNAGMLTDRVEEAFWHAENASHFQQFCAVEGYLEYEGNRVPINGTCIRDHSWGVRDLSILDNHVWLSGYFPSGRSFMVMHIEPRNEHTGTDFKATSDISIDTGSGLELATISRIPLITNDSQVMDPYTLELTTADGKAHEIDATIMQACPINLLGKNEMGFGTDFRPESTHALWETFARYEWDGEVAYGLTERSVARPIGR